MNEILETVKEITAAAVKKADQTCKVTRLKLSKAALGRLLKEQYIELGKTVYDMCKSGEEDSQEVAAMTVQIDGTRRRLKALDRRIAHISELVQCPGCGAVLKIKNTYCPHCGKRLAEEEELITENENEMIVSQE